MKKLLLIVAMVALTLGASADNHSLEMLWEISDVSFLPTTDSRQGFGMNGKFYINNKATQTIYEVDQNGLTGVTFPGGANCGISRDEAGNIIVSNAVFASRQWTTENNIIVINPTTGKTVYYTIPEKCGMQGRCDFIGFAKGDMTDKGVLYLTGGNNDTQPYTDGIVVFSVSGGEVDYDNCYLATVDNGIIGQSSTVINYYTDINGEDAWIYAYRSGKPSKLTSVGKNFAKTEINLPLYGAYAKGTSNGAFPFVWNGKEFIIYPLTPNYRDGWAIAENGADEPIAGFAFTATANPNTFQCNWLNAEVDADGVTIYQYMPGLCLRVFRLSTPPTNVYILGQVNDQEWAANAGTLMNYNPVEKIYTNIVSFSGESYFSFTTELAEDNDEGAWAYIEPYRFGAVSDGDFWYSDVYDGQPLSLTSDNYQAFRVMGGTYRLTVSLEDMTLTIKKVVYGDVNEDGGVNIQDVSALIDFLLSGDMTGVNADNADCDKNQSVSISDVSALIDYLLYSAY